MRTGAPIADERLRQPRHVGLRAAERSKRVAAVVADMILHRGAVVAPGMRQPPRPARWSDGIDEIVERALARLRPISGEPA